MCSASKTESTVLHVARVYFSVAFGKAGIVSHAWGNTLRGGFGHALREISCALRRDDCAGCVLGRECAYGYLFETPIQAADTVMRKYPNAPHPFVIEPTASCGSFVSKEHDSSFSFVLIGRAYRYLPHVLLAVNRLGEMGLGRDRVPFEVRAITNDSGEVLYDRSSGSSVHPIAPRAFSIEPGQSKVQDFSVVLETPLRLQKEGSILEAPNLFDIVAALRRRVFLLCCFHGEGRISQLSSSFLDAACEVRMTRSRLDWFEGIRRSTRQQREIPLGGVQGRLDGEGDFGILKPLLHIGEYVHVGKNATFGLGKIRIEEGKTI